MAHIERLDIIPDIDTSTVEVTVLGNAAAQSHTARVVITDKEGHKVRYCPPVLHMLLRNDTAVYISMLNREHPPLSPDPRKNARSLGKMPEAAEYRKKCLTLHICR